LNSPWVSYRETPKKVRKIVGKKVGSWLVPPSSVLLLLLLLRLLLGCCLLDPGTCMQRAVRGHRGNCTQGAAEGGAGGGGGEGKGGGRDVGMTCYVLRHIKTKSKYVSLVLLDLPCRKTKKNSITNSSKTNYIPFFVKGAAILFCIFLKRFSAWVLFKKLFVVFLNRPCYETPKNATQNVQH
jgi:hypothetical protein